MTQLDSKVRIICDIARPHAQMVVREMSKKNQCIDPNRVSDESRKWAEALYDRIVRLETAGPMTTLKDTSHE